MTLSNCRCVKCHASDWRATASLWACRSCGQHYPCVEGMPRLYIEERVGREDLVLRDYFYNGMLGRYYQHIMPFLALPVRPGYWKGWLAYWLICAALFGLVGYAGFRLAWQAWGQVALSPVDALAAALLVAVAFFFAKHRYLLHLLLLAVPVKLSLRSTRFRPKASFAEIHADVIAGLKARQGPLRILDISTGTCNSLYRHGWMELDADFTGLDLSETMLLQGRALMTARRVPMDFVLGDAMQLPFQADIFDVVLNYGALNGYSDAGQALAEMARVARPGGLVLVLDEHLYEGASAVERLYFRRVLANHDVYDRFPAELLPPELTGAKVYQVYHFYYLCVAHKR